MTKNRAEEERVLSTGKIGPPRNGQLKLALQHNPQLLAVVLDGVLASPAGLDDVDVRFQKDALAEGDQPFVVDSLASAQGVDIEHRPASGPRNEIAVGARPDKERGEVDLERVCDPLQRRQRRHHGIALYLRQHAFRTTRQVGKRLLAEAFSKSGMLDSGAEKQRQHRRFLVGCGQGLPSVGQCVSRMWPLGLLNIVQLWQNYPLTINSEK